MKALKITETKNFMGILLKSDCFADFLLAEASITTYNTFSIDGHIVPAFYKGDVNAPDEEPPYRYSCWKDLQELCFQFIRGKRTPVRFHFTLYLKPDKIKTLFASDLFNKEHAPLPEELDQLVLNIKYQEGTLALITAVSYHRFVMDKSAEKIWDHYINRFLDDRAIPYEEKIS